MQFAIVDGQKQEASPNDRGTCPLCEARAIAKCGQINIWHWAHQSMIDCDPWYEPEGSWHRAWKDLVRPEFCEVRIGEHRADIVGNQGLVIELQHSAISPDEIVEREEFYKRMIWLFDASPFEENLDLRKQREYWSFRWKHARKSHGACTLPLFWELEDGRIFLVKKLHAEESPVGGWGRFVPRVVFFDRYLSQVLKPCQP